MSNAAEIQVWFGLALDALEKIEAAWDADAALVHDVAMQLDPEPRRHWPWPERLSDLRGVIHRLEGLHDEYMGG
jgi:hypothetical protein